MRSAYRVSKNILKSESDLSKRMFSQKLLIFLNHITEINILLELVKLVRRENFIYDIDLYKMLLKILVVLRKEKCSRSK